MSREPDWYQVLGVAPNATPAVIKAAFRQKARATHPDTSQQSTPEAFYLVRKAGALLLDPVRRTAYDLRRQQIATKPSAYPDSFAAWTACLAQQLQKMEAQTWQSHNKDANYVWLYDHYQAFLANPKTTVSPSGGQQEPAPILKQFLAFLPHLAYRDQAYFLQVWATDFKGETAELALAQWQQKLFWQRLWTAHQVWWVLLFTALILAGLALF